MRVGECWLWTGHLARGYGRATYQGRPIGAHRLSWMLSNGANEPHGYVIMHMCDNKQCVRPSHLQRGSTAENMWDLIDKGRGPWDRYYSRGAFSMDDAPEK